MHLINRKTATTVLTAMIFIIMLVSSAYPFDGDSPVDLEGLIEQGEALFHEGRYGDALAVFIRALPLDGEPAEVNRLHLDLSRTYFKLNDIERSEEYLRKLFESGDETVLEDSGFEDEYRLMIKKISAEYWFTMRSVNQIDKKEDRRIIAQMSKKPEKKRNKLLSILLVGGVLVASAVALVMLMGDSTEENLGMLKVTNSSLFRITVTIGSVFRTISPGESEIIYLEPGDYTVSVLCQNIRYNYPVAIMANQTSVLNFSVNLTKQ